MPFLPSKHDLVLGRSFWCWPFPTIRISDQTRATHVYAIGITGQGKSKLLQHLLYQDVTKGHGCGLLDPHTDLAQDLLGQLLESGFFKDQKSCQRVIYFEPSSPRFFLPFNVLASGFPPYATAANIVEAFKRTWPESLREAPRFTNILLASLLTLIANHLTLVDLPKMLSNKEHREALLQNVADEEVISVFHDRMDKWGRDEAVMLESILNKLSAFTLNPTLRQILGQKENQLDFRKIMDEGKVLIVDLGRCDSETRKLLGSLITTGIEQAALSRKDEPTRTRRSFYFYLDEFQDFCANEGSVLTFSQILSEARKFGLSLTLAHQTLGQMEYGRIRSALGNIGTKIVFAVDRDDAEVMAKKLFLVETEKVKHEVEDEDQQERSHPVYYSLGEEWEKAVQEIQSLKPRTCLVKIQGKNLKKVYTMNVPSNAGNLQTELDQLLGRENHWQAERAEKKLRGRKYKSRIVDYVEINTERQQVIELM